MKIIMSAIMVLFCYCTISAQEGKSTSTFEKFVSETGSLTIIEYYNLPEIIAYTGELQTWILIAKSPEEKSYFYRISGGSQYNNKTVTITEKDLVEIIRALAIIIKHSKNIKTNSDFLVSRFTTEVGFQVGFNYVKNGIQWFMKLDGNGIGDTIILNDEDQIRWSLDRAKKKIDDLKALQN